MLKKTFICICILFFICILNVKADKNYITDNAYIFKNKEILIENCQKFLDKYNICLYYYTIDTSNEEKFQEIINSYENFNEEDFILFYITKDNGNVAIYTSSNLSALITDVNKIVLLKSMEIDLNEGNFEQAMICATNNLSEIINDYNENKIENEKLVLNLENKNKQQQFSIIGMIVFAGIFIGGMFYLFKDLKKERKKE